MNTFGDAFQMWRGGFYLSSSSPASDIHREPTPPLYAKNTYNNYQRKYNE